MMLCFLDLDGRKVLPDDADAADTDATAAVADAMMNKVEAHDDNS